MAITLRDIYEDVIIIEQSISKLKDDIDRAGCDTITKCRLIEEQRRLEIKYYQVLYSNFKFQDLDFFKIIESINNCMSCVTISYR